MAKKKQKVSLAAVERDTPPAPTKKPGTIPGRRHYSWTDNAHVWGPEGTPWTRKEIRAEDLLRMAFEALGDPTVRVGRVDRWGSENGITWLDARQRTAMAEQMKDGPGDELTMSFWESGDRTATMLVISEEC